VGVPERRRYAARVGARDHGKVLFVSGAARSRQQSVSAAARDTQPTTRAADLAKRVRRRRGRPAEQRAPNVARV